MIIIILISVSVPGHMVVPSIYYCLSYHPCGYGSASTSAGYGSFPEVVTQNSFLKGLGHLSLCLN